MQGKIGLEEHFGLKDTIEDSTGFAPEHLRDELRARLLDIHGLRLREMDAHGMEMMLLSLNAPTVQGIPDTKRAIELARRTNDYLAAEVAKRPDRFQGLAALAMQDPDEATREYERCIQSLRFRGALVNGFSQVGSAENCVYLDDPRYNDFWAKVAALDYPFYLHPRNPIPRDAQIYAGHTWLLGPSWAFAQETAVHALRLIASGLFDRHPNLQIVLGHMGEGLPFNLWRIDNRNGWMAKGHGTPAKHPVAHYMQNNFYITTSGHFRTPALLATMMELGVDRIMFSTDWPFESIELAARWFDHAEISEADRLKIGRTNALKLYKLGG